MTPRRRVRQVMLTSDAVGGVWTYSCTLARGLALRGIKVTLVTLGPPPRASQVSELLSPSIELIQTSLPLDWDCRSQDELRTLGSSLQDLAETVDPDVAHFHAPSLLGDTLWRCATIVVVHSCIATWWNAVRRIALADDLGWHARVSHAGLRRADVVLAPSKAFARHVEAAYSGVRVQPVLNGIKLPRSAVIPQSQRSMVLAAGRLWDEAKNIAVLEIAASGSSVAIHAAGPCTGPNGQHITLGALIHLGTLSRDELAAAYANTAIFVSPSLYEPFGLAVLEAAANGASLVLSDIPTHRELWSGAAVFVPPDRPDLLRTAIDALHMDFARRDTLAIAARRRACAYSDNISLSRTVSAYEKAVHRFGGRTTSSKTLSAGDAR